MWEMRGEPRHHLSSKVLCWVALDRAIALSPQLAMHAEVDRWTAERDEIREAVLTRGWSEARQAYAQSFDSDALDAAQLLMPIVGFLPATDERMRSTIDAIADGLTEDGLVLRYRNEEGLNADGLTGEEGTFVICSFWLVSALAKAGEIDRAERLFDKLVALRQRPRAAGRGDRHRERRAAGQLPAGVQSHWADYRCLGDRQGSRTGLVITIAATEAARRRNRAPSPFRARNAHLETFLRNGSASSTDRVRPPGRTSGTRNGKPLRDHADGDVGAGWFRALAIDEAHHISSERELIRALARGDPVDRNRPA